MKNLIILFKCIFICGVLKWKSTDLNVWCCEVFTNLFFYLLSCSNELHLFRFSPSFSLDTEVKTKPFLTRNKFCRHIFCQCCISTFFHDKCEFNSYLQRHTHYTLQWSWFWLTSVIFLISRLILISVIVISLYGIISSWTFNSVTIFLVVYMFLCYSWQNTL